MFKNLDQVETSARSIIESWFSKVIEEFEDRIDSIYLYGSVVTAEFKPNESNINSLILFKTFSFQGVTQIQPFVKEGLKSRLVAPLCLSVETFERSSDTFPLEFIEIKDKHLCIFGDQDRVESLPIPMENLRVKIEEQIKGKLIRLRQIFMEQGHAPKALLSIMEEALRELMPVFRNMLRFQGVENPPVIKREILDKLQSVNSFSMQSCFQILDSLKKTQSIPTAETEKIYSEFADVLLELAGVIDQLEQV